MSPKSRRRQKNQKSKEIILQIFFALNFFFFFDLILEFSILFSWFIFIFILLTYWMSDWLTGWVTIIPNIPNNSNTIYVTIWIQKKKLNNAKKKLWKKFIKYRLIVFIFSFCFILFFSCYSLRFKGKDIDVVYLRIGF